MILGLGMDIVEIERLAASIDRSGDSFLRHVYTAREIEAAPPLSSKRRLEYLAGRWAAKEAVAKALGTGICEKCPMREIDIVNDEAGRPVIMLTGRAAETAASKGVAVWHLTITHERNYAAATAVCEGELRK